MNPHCAFIPAALAIGLSACDGPACTNRNPVFDRASYSSQEYQQELADRINRIGMDKLSYWLDAYVQEHGNEYILVDVRHDSLCAMAMIRVKDWDKIEGVKRTKGVSYKGAELRGLTFSVINDSSGVEFIYRTLDRIVD